MKKIRFLALLLVLLMVSSAFIFAACDNTSGDSDECADGEHEWKNEKNEQKRPVVQDLTCTTPEIRERECKKCGKRENYESTPAAGHRYNSTLKVYQQDATCTEDGHTVSHCMFYDICGAAADKVEVLVGSALGHEYVNYVSMADGYSAVAKCVRCSVTSEKLLGLKLDMDGDRSHLSYQAMSTYTDGVADAAKFETEGDNTYLTLTRPANYLGNPLFAVVLNPVADNLTGNKYIVEATFMLDKDGTGDLVLFKGVKSMMNQSMTFLTYNSTTKTISGLDGAIYTLSDADFENGIKVGVLLDDTNQIYQVYINDKLASYRPIAYQGSYFPGIAIKSIEISMMESKNASTFSVDDIFLYTGETPKGYDNEATDGSNSNITYGVHTLVSGQNISYKLPVNTDQHVDCTFAPTATYAADCVLSGYTVYTCSGCGGEKIDDEIAANGHDFDAGVEVPPNCFEAGFIVYTCNTCGQKKGEQNAAMIEHEHDSTATVVAATCTEDGYTEGACRFCGANFKVVDEGSKLGHALGDDATYVQPTCSVDGYKTGKCVRCGVDYTDPDFTIKAYGHYDFDFSEFTTVEADCENAGYEEHTCLSCGEKYKENEVAALGHRKYSKVEQRADADYIVTKCLLCDFLEETKLSSSPTPPTMVEVLENVASGDRIKLWDGTNASGNDGYDKEVTANDLTARYAKFSVLTESGNSYMQAQTNGAKDGHSYWNFGLNDTTFTKKNTATVFEFDIRIPDGKTAVDRIEIQGMNRYNGSPNGDSYIKINKGKVLFNGADTGYTLGNEWARITFVYDFAGKTVSGYFNGILLGSATLPEWFDSLNYFRLNLYRALGSDQYVDFDNLMLYYGDKPSYVTAAAEAKPFLELKPGDSSTFSFVTAEGYTDRISHIHGAQVISKLNAAFKLVDRDGDGTNDAINYTTGPDVETGPANAGTNQTTSGTDTHFTVTGFTKGGTTTFRVKVKFNKVTGSVALVQGRRVATGGNPQYNFLNYSYVGVDGDGKAYGKLTTMGGTETIATVYEGDVFDVYIVDYEGSNSADVYVNGELKVLGASYASATNYCVEHTQLTVKFLNNGSANPLDIDIMALDAYNSMVIPSDYNGNKVEPNYVYSFEKNPIVKFDGTEKLENILVGGSAAGDNSANIPNGYIYTTVEGQSYLSLSKNPASAHLGGNAKYVMIDPVGNVVDEGGVWTFNVGKFKSAGSVPEIYFNDFEGVKRNADGYYDFTDYNKLTIRVFIKDATTNGFKFQLRAHGPNKAGSDGKVGISYWSLDIKQVGSGWYELSMNIDPNAESVNRYCRWDSINTLVLGFTGWSNGPTGNGSAADAMANDDFEIFVESISLVKNDITLPDTGYTIKGELCEEHTYGEPVVYAATACGEVEYSYKLCSTCGYKDLTVAGEKAHTLKVVAEESKAATCNADGYTTSVCEVCGDKFKDILQMTTHDFVLKENATAADGYIAAGCETGGQDVYICANEGCPHADKTFVLATEATGHRIDEGDGEKVPANCTDDEKVIGECAICGDDCEIATPNTALGHNLVTVEDPATCEEEGHITIECDRADCDYVEQDDVIDPLGHIRPADYRVDIIERSCASYPGIKYNCLRCNEEVKELDESQGKDLHTWGEWIDIVQPNCGTNGSRDKICSVCNLRMSEHGTAEEQQLCIILAVGEHNYDRSQYVYSSDDTSVVRTKYYACTICGAADPDSIIEVPADHEGTAGLVFTDNKKGQYVITGYTGTAKAVVIPATYAGKPVILGNGLAGTDITSVEIADGVEINAGAFAGCTALSTVKLPSDMVALPQDIFSGCTALKNVVLPESCTLIGTGAFYGCAQLATLEIKGTLTEIQQFAFAGCDALATIKYVVAIIPESVIAENGNDVLFEASWVTA